VKNWTNFAPWKKFLDASTDDSLANPFGKDVLTKDAAFLYCETTAPVPCASMAGIWLAYPTPQQMASHLNYGILPNLFSIWLCRDEWDPNPMKPLTLQDLFSGARKAENRYVNDIPRMEATAKLVETAMRSRRAAAAWRDIEVACRRFNARWKSTPTWNFVLRPYRDPEAVARAIVRHCGFVVDVDKSQVRELATRILSDRKAQKQFKALLADCVVC
jgi:hypothetical protein